MLGLNSIHTARSLIDFLDDYASGVVSLAVGSLRKFLENHTPYGTVFHKETVQRLFPDLDMGDYGRDRDHLTKDEFITASYDTGQAHVDKELLKEAIKNASESEKKRKPEVAPRSSNMTSGLGMAGSASELSHGFSAKGASHDEDAPAVEETVSPHREVSAPKSSPGSSLKPVYPRMSERQSSAMATNGFTCTIPFEDAGADCLVICCSDQRFTHANLEFLGAMGFEHPHMVRFPAGLVAAHPLISSLSMISKGLDKLLDKAVKAAGVKEVICIAHEDCAAYKLEDLGLLSNLVKRGTGKDIRGMQMQHLANAAKRLRVALPGVRVRAYFAEVLEDQGKVRFKEILFS